jgi:hypothetical protein
MSLIKKPGTKPMPTLNADLNRANEISDDKEVSNIQMMKGISTNIMAPLTLCNMETQPAGGKRYVVRSVKALMFRNSGRFLASSVMRWSFEGLLVLGGQLKILLQRSKLTGGFHGCVGKQIYFYQSNSLW